MIFSVNFYLLGLYYFILPPSNHALPTVAFLASSILIARVAFQDRSDSIAIMIAISTLFLFCAPVAAIAYFYHIDVIYILFIYVITTDFMLWSTIGGSHWTFFSGFFF
jgi:hypothetical protein